MNQNQNQTRHKAHEQDLSSIAGDIQRIVGRADLELEHNLQLFVERIMLYRITRVKDKGPELEFFSSTLMEASKLGGDPSLVLKEISELQSIAAKGGSVPTSAIFSTLVDSLEKMNGKQLYYFLDRLRSSRIKTREDSEN